MLKRLLRKLGLWDQERGRPWTKEDRERAAECRAAKKERFEKMQKKRHEYEERKLDLKIRELDLDERKIEAKEWELELPDDEYEDEADDGRKQPQSVAETLMENAPAILEALGITNLGGKHGTTEPKRVDSTSDGKIRQHRSQAGSDSSGSERLARRHDRAKKASRNNDATKEIEGGDEL